MTKLRAVIFDLDGTLIDSAPLVTQAIQQTMINKTGKHIPLADLQQFVGPPLSTTFRNLGAGAETSAYVEEYRRLYSQTINQTPLFPGVRELLKKLQNSGIFMAIATSKREDLAQQICAELDIAHFFTKICGADLADKKADKATIIGRALQGFYEAGQLDKPSDVENYRSDVVMVGDRIYDIVGAKTHNIATILLTWGAAPAEEYQQAYQLADSALDLEKLLLA
ncbi:MAG: HAD hydrolase-like protein [Actinomycetaceae bacterium]|nr:HAD hydrolase-like protein [Actinomycetaceae bacterium]